jgi:hypothetical protein
MRAMYCFLPDAESMDTPNQIAVAKYRPHSTIATPA